MGSAPERRSKTISTSWLRLATFPSSESAIAQYPFPPHLPAKYLSALPSRQMCAAVIPERDRQGVQKRNTKRNGVKSCLLRRRTCLCRWGERTGVTDRVELRHERGQSSKARRRLTARSTFLVAPRSVGSPRRSPPPHSGGIANKPPSRPGSPLRGQTAWLRHPDRPTARRTAGCLRACERRGAPIDGNACCWHDTRSRVLRALQACRGQALRAVAAMKPTRHEVGGDDHEKHLHYGRDST